MGLCSHARACIFCGDDEFDTVHRIQAQAERRQRNREHQSGQPGGHRQGRGYARFDRGITCRAGVDHQSILRSVISRVACQAPACEST